MGVCLADDITLNFHVHHDEVSPIEAVGHDAAHEGCRQYYRIGFLFIKELFDGILVSQVKLLVATTNQVLVTTCLQVIPYCRANQSMMAGYVNLTILV